MIIVNPNIAYDRTVGDARRVIGEEDLFWQFNRNVSLERYYAGRIAFVPDCIIKQGRCRIEGQLIRSIVKFWLLRN